MHHHSSSPHRALWLERRRRLEATRGRSAPGGPRGRSLLDRLLPPAVAARLARLPLSRGRHNACALRAVELAVTFPDLPPTLDGFTILHLTDPHPGTLPGLIDRAAVLAAELPCDLAVLTGDVQVHGRPAAAEAAGLLAPLLDAVRARHGIFGVLGNHDRHDLVPALEDRGVRMLVNEHAVIVHAGARLVVTGTDDVHRFYTPAADRALATAPPGFRVALVHSPEFGPQAEAAGTRLYLTGHTHGGQVCLPGGVPVFTASDAPRRVAAGRWRLGSMEGYTSRGLGVGLPPVRFNCPGEITRLTLRRA